MSGPIIRKYGFPNFDEIFGKKELAHGVDESTTPPSPVKENEDSIPKPAERREKKAEKA